MEVEYFQTEDEGAGIGNISRQDEEDILAQNIRYRVSTTTLTQEVLLSTLEIYGTNISARGAAPRKYPLKFICQYENVVLDGGMVDLLEYRHLIKWSKYKYIWGASFGNEIGLLAQGIPVRVEGTNTMSFINNQKVPQDCVKEVTYGWIVCDYQEQKEENNWTIMTVSIYSINYPDDCGTPTGDLLVVKLLLGSDRVQDIY